MNSTTCSDPTLRAREEVIAARIRKEATLQRIIDESAIDFLFCKTDRTPFGITSRILILIGAIGFLYAWAKLGYPWLIAFIAFIALTASVEAFRANRRIDALVELQNLYKRSEQAAPSDR